MSSEPRDALTTRNQDRLRLCHYQRQAARLLNTTCRSGALASGQAVLGGWRLAHGVGVRNGLQLVTGWIEAVIGDGAGVVQVQHAADHRTRLGGGGDDNVQSDCLAWLNDYRLEGLGALHPQVSGARGHGRIEGLSGGGGRWAGARLGGGGGG